MNIKEELYVTLHDKYLFESFSKEEYQGIRGGMAGRLSFDGVPLGSSNASCPRKALLRANNVEEAPSLSSYLTFETGTHWEKLFGELKGSQKIKNFRQDVKVLTEDGFSGSVDAVGEINGKLTVFELKSVSSLSSFEKVFINREIPDSYISQCVSYMNAMKASDGYIVFASFIYASQAYLTAGIQRKLGKVLPDITQFKVLLKNDDVFINDEFYCSYRNIKAHADVVAESIRTKKPYPIRPDRDMCFFCPFKTVCDEFDRDNSIDFINKCRSVL